MVVITDLEIYRDSIISTTGRPPTGIALKDVVRWERGEVLGDQIADGAKQNWRLILYVGLGIAVIYGLVQCMSAGTCGS